MQPVRGTAPAAPVIHAVPAAQPMQAAGQPAPVAQPVQVAKPVQPIIMPSKPMEEATTPVQGKKSATKTSPRTTVQSAPAKTDPIQSERLGGTETPSRKDDRLNDGETLRPAADVMPRSFWGVKVHKEAHPLHVEDVSRAPATDTVQQGAVKAVEGHGTRADTRSGEPATASDMVRREQHTDAKADNGFSSHTPDQSQKQTQSPEPVRAVSEKPADVPHVKTDEPSQSTPQAVTPGKEFAREVAGDAAVSSPLPRAVFTLEQIKDLQAMVSKSLQGTRTTLDGSKEAVFKWNHEALGPLAFRISAKNSDVEIRIQSGRKDVADALEEGRPAMERIFADLGLKMERFEVKVRGEAMSHEPTTQTQEREHSQHGRKANSEAATGTNMDMELETEEEAPQRAPALADREWVA
ncbi:MAG TPA: flagellar hook-length control protein FliK [bacterium]